MITLWESYEPDPEYADEWDPEQFDDDVDDADLYDIDEEDD